MPNSMAKFERNVARALVGKYKPRRRKARISRPLKNAPLPNRMVARLRYSTSIVLQTVAGSLDNHIFSANGCYDPDVTGVGHQPRGFDQLMAMYDHFTVVNSKINVTFRNGGDTVTPSLPVAVSIILSDDNAPFASSNDIYESSKVRYSVLTHPEGSKAQCILGKKYNAKQFFTRGKIADASELRGSAIANPTDGAYFHVNMDTYSQLTNCTVDGLVVIDYVVLLSEPKQPGQS